MITAYHPQSKLFSECSLWSGSRQKKLPSELAHLMQLIGSAQDACGQAADAFS